MALVIAYDKTTGKRISNPVPEHFIGHPQLGPNLTTEPIFRPYSADFTDNLSAPAEEEEK